MVVSFDPFQKIIRRDSVSIVNWMKGLKLLSLQRKSIGPPSCSLAYTQAGESLSIDTDARTAELEESYHQYRVYGSLLQ